MKRIRGSRGRRGRGRRVVIGRPDPSLTGVSGLVAVDRLAAKLGMAAAIDARVEAADVVAGRSSGHAELNHLTMTCSRGGQTS